jgi:hypothetical protein
MAGTVNTANFNDALAIEAGKIVVNGVEWGFVSGLMIDGKAPEDFINVLTGTLRRRKPETVEWSVDAVVLYNNIKDLNTLRSGVLFQIVVDFTNPDVNAPANNRGQTLTLEACRVQDHSINLNESSTFKISGRASYWSVTQK